jgi:MFS superfamily sulfate permease-like transporter
MLRKLFPFLSWFEHYNLSKLRSDLIAGVTVALVLIPQSMAYAKLAGLPVYYGLYAAFLPPMIAALFGSSYQLATGPVAVVSLMTAAALEPLATAGSQGFIAYAILIALMVGIFQLLLGVFKLGLVVNFLSHPVVNGFTNAAALIIATSQLSSIFGVDVESGAHQYETIYHVLRAALVSTHLVTLGLAVLAFAIMIILRRINPRIPNVLVAVVITTLISWAIGFEHNYKCKIKQITYPQVRLLINKFNTTLDGIDQETISRTSLNSEIGRKEKKYGQHSSEIMELRFQLALLNLKIDEQKKQLRITREELRALRFTGVKQNDGTILFYVKREVPPAARMDGDNWRINIGNQKINNGSIQLTGGGAVVGNIPAGLPAFKIPGFNFGVVLNLFPIAAIISLLGFMEAISIAKAMAAKTGQRLDPNQELIGQGLSNIVGSFSQSYAVSGSFSRSAVNLQAGAATGMSSVFTSGIVMVSLLFLTPLLYYLPQSVLAAIIMMAVVNLVNVKSFIHAWQAQKYDGAIAIITFVCTLVFAPNLDIGITVVVALSLVLFLIRTMNPEIAMLSKYTDGTYRDSARFNLEQCRHIAVIRFNRSLFFSNVNYLEEKILNVVSSMPELKHILVVANAINELDASGEETLSMLTTRLRDAGYDISFSGFNDSILDVIRRTHLYDKIGEDHLFRNVAFAIEKIYESVHKNSNEKDCPLMKVCFKGLTVSADVKHRAIITEGPK